MYIVRVICRNNGSLDVLSISYHIIHAKSEFDQSIFNLLGFDPVAVNSPLANPHNHSE